MHVCVCVRVGGRGGVEGEWGFGARPVALILTVASKMRRMPDGMVRRGLGSGVLSFARAGRPASATLAPSVIAVRDSGPPARGQRGPGGLSRCRSRSTERAAVECAFRAAPDRVPRATAAAPLSHCPRGRAAPTVPNGTRADGLLDPGRRTDHPVSLSRSGRRATLGGPGAAPVAEGAPAGICRVEAQRPLVQSDRAGGEPSAALF